MNRLLESDRHSTDHVVSCACQCILGVNAGRVWCRDLSSWRPGAAPSPRGCMPASTQRSSRDIVGLGLAVGSMTPGDQQQARMRRGNGNCPGVVHAERALLTMHLMILQYVMVLERFIQHGPRKTLVCDRPGCSRIWVRFRLFTKQMAVSVRSMCVARRRHDCA